MSSKDQRKKKEKAQVAINALLLYIHTAHYMPERDAEKAPTRRHPSQNSLFKKKHYVKLVRYHLILSPTFYLHYWEFLQAPPTLLKTQKRKTLTEYINIDDSTTNQFNIYILQ